MQSVEINESYKYTENIQSLSHCLANVDYYINFGSKIFKMKVKCTKNVYTKFIYSIPAYVLIFLQISYFGGIFRVLLLFDNKLCR